MSEIFQVKKLTFTKNATKKLQKCQIFNASLLILYENLLNSAILTKNAKFLF